MSYVERNLIPGEKVFYKTGQHWSVLIGPCFVGAVFAIGGTLLAVYGYDEKSGTSTSNSSTSATSELLLAGIVLLFAVAAISIIAGVVRRNSTEMAVTNKRVVVKRGILSRRTFELLLSQIEGILVEESFMGRMLGFGTVIIRGTGGTPETFVKIAHPLEFRRQVQEHIEIYQQQGSVAPPLPR
jgi:uncharacterized membrane protein YdbT with pleckstrin-like domain